MKADAELKAKSSSENEGNEEEEEDLQAVARKSNISLLSQHTELKKIAQGMNLQYLPLSQTRVSFNA